MDYYTNGCEHLEGAEVLAAAEKYRLAITLLYLACELFLKSFAEHKDPANPLLESHDIVRIGLLIKDDVDYKAIERKLAFMRKYHNNSRYPYNPGIYTKDFYNECLEAVLAIRKAIESASTKKPIAQRLGERFGKDSVTDNRW